MHDTPHEPEEPIVPSPPPATPGHELVTKFDGNTFVSPQVVIKLLSLIDDFETAFRDPPTAWAAIEAELGARKARHTAFQARREARRAAGWFVDPAASRGEPRPFLGFDREEATYERVKPALLESAEGKWVTIVGDVVLGPFDDIGDAEGAGLDRFGDGPLYIKRIRAQEVPVYLPYYVDLPCQT